MPDYYIDWYRIVCPECGIDRPYPVNEGMASTCAVNVAKAIHARVTEDHHIPCGGSDLIVSILEKNARIEYK